MVIGPAGQLAECRAKAIFSSLSGNKNYNLSLLALSKLIIGLSTGIDCRVVSQ